MLLFYIAFLMFSNDFFFFESSSKEWVYFTLEVSNIELVGEVLYLYMGDLFILSSFLLLVAIVGPVYVSRLDESPYLDKKVDS